MSREEIDPTGKSRKAWNNWYRKNRSKLNVSRRLKYKQDPEYRKKIVERQANYRKTLSPKPNDGLKYRVINGQHVRVLSISEASEYIGRSAQSIRIWEAKQWLPQHTTGGVHRYYTEGQVQLMQQIAAKVDRLGKAAEDAEFTKFLEYVHVKWKDA